MLLSLDSTMSIGYSMLRDVICTSHFQEKWKREILNRIHSTSTHADKVNASTAALKSTCYSASRFFYSLVHISSKTNGNKVQTFACENSREYRKCLSFLSICSKLIPGCTAMFTTASFIFSSNIYIYVCLWFLWISSFSIGSQCSAVKTVAHRPSPVVHGWQLFKPKSNDTQSEFQHHKWCFHIKMNWSDLIISRQYIL